MSYFNKTLYNIPLGYLVKSTTQNTQNDGISAAFVLVEADFDTVKDASIFQGILAEGYVPSYNNTSGLLELRDISAVVGSDTYQVKVEAASAIEYVGTTLNKQSNHTTDHTLTSEEMLNKSTSTNIGATGQVIFTLPVGVVGYCREFLIKENEYLQAKAQAGETISYGGTSSASGGYVRSDVVGTAFKLKCTALTEWDISELEGNVDYDK